MDDNGPRDPRELHLHLWIKLTQTNGGWALLGVLPSSPIDQGSGRARFAIGRCHVVSGDATWWPLALLATWIASRSPPVD